MVGPGRISLSKRQCAHLLNSENVEDSGSSSGKDLGKLRGLGWDTGAQPASCRPFFGLTQVSGFPEQWLPCKLYGLRDSQISIETALTRCSQDKWLQNSAPETPSQETFKQLLPSKSLSQEEAHSDEP